MQFDFGRNWSHFSKKSLNPEKVHQARKDFQNLFDGVLIAGRSFLDVGFGQGLSLLIASEMKAHAVGCDISERCSEILTKNRESFFPQTGANVPLIVGSILDDGIIRELRNHSPDNNGSYDIVHSWGVLHHTGDMYQAIENCAGLVRKGGILVLALYNSHWSSPVWSVIKWVYCKAPSWLQHTMIAFFYPVIWLAKLLATKKDPLEQSRGMDFYYNVIDWIGGYPYECASIDQIQAFVSGLGYKCIKIIPAQVPTGCNEFIFQRN
jgi:2-polyprenyl-3-methyl-5-hydroxy-6-metoxy-1,4-benzoquinol methylase